MSKYFVPDALGAIVEPLLPHAGGAFSEQRGAIHGTVGGLSAGGSNGSMLPLAVDAMASRPLRGHGRRVAGACR
jgi:hypothetical protein